ncbi:MAG: endonuclease [Gemmatimonadetes bacterium]|nr:endonuclease [Gemmatimonadota bacterium]
MNGRPSRLSAALGILLLLILVGARGSQTDPITVRVLTYNVHHGQGTDRQFDLLRLADVMQSVRPDIIALQEVDQATERSDGVNQFDEFVRLLGMHGEFGRAIDYMGGGYGVAVLSRWPLLSPDNQPLPASLENEPRTALTVLIRAGQDGPILKFTSTHLDNSRDSTDRIAQAARLNELLVSGDAQSSILAGDFNARQGTAAMEILAAQWTNAVPVSGLPPDSSPPGRGRRSDYVLFRPAERWRVIESRVIDEGVASDHRPVLTVLEWLGP